MHASPPSWAATRDSSRSRTGSASAFSSGATCSACSTLSGCAVSGAQARLARAGLAAVDERDTTCCYARQDKFWVTGAPGGERWEIYTVLADSPTFWGQDSEQRWDAVQAELDGAPAGQATQCCGGPQAGDTTGD